jgi:hypothetical protein
VIYLKSLAIGLLAGAAAIVVQSVMFHESQSVSDGGFVVANTSATDIYAAPVVIASAAGVVAAWWRLRTKRLRR